MGLRDGESDRHEVDLSVAELRGLGEMPNQKAKAQSVGDGFDEVDDEAGAEDEYEFEADLRREAATSLKALRQQIEEDAREADDIFGDDEPAVTSVLDVMGSSSLGASRSSSNGPSNGAASSSSCGPSASPGVAIDWARYDACIQPDTNPRYQRVVRDGRVCGQSQPMTVIDSYRVFALCFCGAHKTRCSRSRCWKSSSGASPGRVNQVLAKWLLECDAHTSTTSHMKASRD